MTAACTCVGCRILALVQEYEAGLGPKEAGRKLAALLASVASRMEPQDAAQMIGDLALTTTLLRAAAEADKPAAERPPSVNDKPAAERPPSVNDKPMGNA